jgi:NADH dehydrogenase/NADH:ubiquinone oxidoreductase subunit G
MNINITVNGKQTDVKAGTTILAAAQKLGFDIPTFCYDPTLEVYGGCRICVVEVAGARDLVASCNAKATDGMVVNTESEKVIEARKNILMLLLANHPNDCLTCQKAGSCKLQEYAYRYGVRFEEQKVRSENYPIEDENPYIVRDMNKCILCGKCIRSCAQVEDRKVLYFANRGAHTKVVTAFDMPYEDSKCVHCFRCVTVCPVGALTDKRAMKKGRAWDIDAKAVTCMFCDYGCNFEVGMKDGKVAYVTPKSPDRGRPLCLKGKIGNELKYIDNPEKPYMKKDGKFIESTWSEAMELTEIVEKIISLEKGKK